MNPILKKILILLIVIGAINWGLIGINPEWNLVTLIFGFNASLVQIIYILVGIAGLWGITLLL